MNQRLASAIESLPILMALFALLYTPAHSQHSVMLFEPFQYNNGELNYVAPNWMESEAPDPHWIVQDQQLVMNDEQGTAYINSPCSEPTYIGFDLKIASTEADSVAYFIIREGSDIHSSRGLASIIINYTSAFPDSIYVSDGDSDLNTSARITRGRTHHFLMHLDWKTDHYDVYMDGELLMGDLAFDPIADSVDLISCSSMQVDSIGTHYWDNFFVAGATTDPNPNHFFDPFSYTNGRLNAVSDHWDTLYENGGYWNIQDGELVIDDITGVNLSPTAYMESPCDQPTIVSFDLETASGGTDSEASFFLRQGTDPYDSPMALGMQIKGSSSDSIFLRNNGAMYYTGYSINRDKSYHCQFEIHWETLTYDFYMNGSPIGRDLSMDATITAVDYLSLNVGGSTTSGTHIWDNVMVVGPEEESASNDYRYVLGHLTITQWESSAGYPPYFDAPNYVANGDGLGIYVSDPNKTFGYWQTIETLEPIPAGYYSMKIYITPKAGVSPYHYPEMRARVFRADNSHSKMAVFSQTTPDVAIPPYVEVLWESDGTSPWRIAIDILSFLPDITGGYVITDITNTAL